jgi:hypothetical protein
MMEERREADDLGYERKSEMVQQGLEPDRTKSRIQVSFSFGGELILRGIMQ